MTPEQITALVKLITHCGLKFTEAIRLEKKDFDLERGMIHVSAEISKAKEGRFSFIRPSDLEWFEHWLRVSSDNLFPFSEQTIRKALSENKIDLKILRQKLLEEMIDLGADDKIIYAKMGWKLDDTDEENDLHKLRRSVQTFEKKHFPAHGY